MATTKKKAILFTMMFPNYSENTSLSWLNYSRIRTCTLPARVLYEECHLPPLLQCLLAVEQDSSRKVAYLRLEVLIYEEETNFNKQSSKNCSFQTIFQKVYEQNQDPPLFSCNSLVATSPSAEEKVCQKPKAMTSQEYKDTHRFHFCS
tara:strand:- start:913 stop:1356 length:444 start_codon:yes stop_codon:yes gene_type:complete